MGVVYRLSSLDFKPVVHRGGRDVVRFLVDLLCVVLDRPSRPWVFRVSVPECPFMLLFGLGPGGLLRLRVRVLVRFGVHAFGL